MKQNAMLTVASLLSILFMTFHLKSDTLHARSGRLRFCRPTPRSTNKMPVHPALLAGYIYR